MKRDLRSRTAVLQATFCSLRLHARVLQYASHRGSRAAATRYASARARLNALTGTAQPSDSRSARPNQIMSTQRPQTYITL